MQISRKSQKLEHFVKIALIREVFIFFNIPDVPEKWVTPIRFLFLTDSN